MSQIKINFDNPPTNKVKVLFPLAHYRVLKYPELSFDKLANNVQSLTIKKINYKK